MLGAAWKIGMACRVALYSTSISSTVCSSSAKPCKHPINCLHLNHKASMLQFKWPWRVLLNGRLCFRAFQSVVVAAQPTSLYTSYEHTAIQTPGVPRLNEEQLKAVEVDEKCVRVVAGPGSGKTLVLTQRIAHLVMNKKHEPSEILCITFTNKAAKELRRRLEGLVGYATIENMTVGTFHSVCAKLLRKFVSQTKVGISSNFVIYDRDDCQRILKRSLVEVLCSSDETSGNDFWLVKEEIKRFLLKDIRSENENIEKELMKSQKRKGSKQNIISSQDIKELLRQIHRARRLEMEEFVAKRTGKYNLNFVNFDTSEIGKLAKAFERSLRRNNAADFDDLIYLVVRMLHEHPDLIEICEKRWTCVLVDEFQDTDGIQYELIRLLCKKNKHLFVVGDVDQAIYGWRGSEIYHMQNSLQNDFPSIKTLQLQHNYRSSNHILKVASEIIENSAYDRRVGSREGLKLHGIKHSNVPVQVCSLNDADMEAQYVVNEICKLQHISSIEIEEFAILYRTHYQAFALEKALITAGMPYKIHGSMPFYSHKEINVLIAYLQYIVNTQDEMAFECIINTPPRGIGEKTINSFRAWSLKRNLSLPESLQILTTANGLHPDLKISSRGRNALLKVDDLLSNLERLSLECPLGILIDEIIERTNFLDYIQNNNDVDAVKKRLDQIKQLKLLAKSFEVRHGIGHPAILLFLEDLALVAGTNHRQQEERGAVKLMTVHAAKGLEFKCVFIIGLNEKLFPLQNSDPEEERRLFYVGITRAKDYLYLTYFRFHNGLESMISSKVSPFLKELSAKAEFVHLP